MIRNERLLSLIRPQLLLMLTTSKGIATFNRIIPIITQKSINAFSKKNITPNVQNNKQNDNIFFSYSNVIPNSQTESFEK